jgi:hypothetical protein
MILELIYITQIVIFLLQQTSAINEVVIIMLFGLQTKKKHLDYVISVLKEYVIKRIEK